MKDESIANLNATCPGGHYVLDENKNPVEVGLGDWAAAMEKRENKIVRQEDVDGLWVSTVFLGLDHGWGDGPPILFETMVFPKPDGKVDFIELHQERCATYAEALEMHERAVEAIKRGEVKAE